MINFKCKKCNTRFRFQNHDEFYKKVMSCDDRKCPQITANLSWAKDATTEPPATEETVQEIILSSPQATIDYVDRRYLSE
jgi:hypothetical protein